MYRIWIAITLLLLSAATHADWTLRQTEDGHWITTVTPEGHQFIVTHNQSEETSFLMVVQVDRQAPPLPLRVSLAVDHGPATEAVLALLERKPDSRLFRIELSDEEKKTFITRMIAGLDLRVWFGERATGKNTLKFSLTGFTAAFNDLLIADRVGRLDPAWLIERHRERELGCYYTANLFVAAMQERIRGRSEIQARESLPRSGQPEVDEMIPDIVSQVYAVPAAHLPIDPRGDKYAIFEECMSQ
ncbi:MAG TPA: hypothetical protein ENJ80_00940 [Gammaproteobacteria bacterium]|nr:hypothetical protein [Gammaproteobacteria bacterium]